MSMTKDQIIAEFFAVAKEYREVNKQLLQLAKENKINSGALLVYLSHHNQSYKWFFDGEMMKDRQKAKTKLYIYVYHLDEFKKSFERAKDFASRPQYGWKNFE